MVGSLGADLVHRPSKRGPSRGPGWTQLTTAWSWGDQQVHVGLNPSCHTELVAWLSYWGS